MVQQQLTIYSHKEQYGGAPSGIKSAKRREMLLREHNYNKIEKIFYDIEDPRFLPSSKSYIGPKKK